MNELLKIILAGLFACGLGMGLQVNASASRFAPVVQERVSGGFLYDGSLSSIFRLAQFRLDEQFKKLAGRGVTAGTEVAELDDAQIMLNLFKGMFDAGLLQQLNQIKEKWLQFFSEKVGTNINKRIIKDLIENDIKGSLANVVTENATIELTEKLRNLVNNTLQEGFNVVATKIEQEKKLIEQQASLTYQIGNLLAKAKSSIGSLWCQLSSYLPQGITNIASNIRAGDKKTLTLVGGAVLVTAVLGVAGGVCYAKFGKKGEGDLSPGGGTAASAKPWAWRRAASWLRSRVRWGEKKEEDKQGNT